MNKLTTVQQNHSDTDHSVEATSTAANLLINNPSQAHTKELRTSNLFLNTLRRQVKESLKAGQYSNRAYKTLIAEWHLLITVFYSRRLTLPALLTSLRKEIKQLAQSKGIYRVLAEHISAQLPAQAAPQSVSPTASSSWTPLKLSRIKHLKNLPKAYVFDFSTLATVEASKCLPAEDFKASDTPLESLSPCGLDTATLDLSGITALKNLPSR